MKLQNQWRKWCKKDNNGIIQLNSVLSWFSLISVNYEITSFQLQAALQKTIVSILSSSKINVDLIRFNSSVNVEKLIYETNLLYKRQ